MAEIEPKNVYGPILLGTFLSLILFGVSTVQIFNYAESSMRKDKRWMICMIAILYTLDMAHSAFTMMTSYDVFVIHMGEIITDSGWAFQMIAWFSAVMGLIVQLFYAWRVRVMLRSNVVAGVVCFGALTSFSGAIVMGVIAAGNQPGFWTLLDYETGLVLWLAGSAVTDVMITTALVFHLKRHKPGIKRTDDVIDSIVRLLWQTFAVTSLCAIIDVVLYLTLASDGAYYITFHYLLPKLYVISLLSSINSRKAFSHRMSDQFTSVPSFAFNHDRTSRGVDATMPAAAQLSASVRGSVGHARNASDGSDNTMIDCDAPIPTKESDSIAV